VNCLNCNSPLTGVFCASCGQQHLSKPPTVAHLLEEVLETLTHADSRLWITLRYLMSKPGVLTREYFAGRRNSYLPPIRLYLIISVGFFLLASLPTAEKSAQKPIEIDSDSQICEADYRGPFANLVAPRLRTACNQLRSDNGARLAENFQRNVPKAMFILLPAFAALMLLFFWRPRRLYVEHLLFLVHNHSAIFAALIIDTLSDLVLPASISGWFSAVLVGYLAWYCWRALQVFYEKSAGKTWALFLMLGFLYSVLSMTTLILTGFASFLAG